MCKEELTKILEAHKQWLSKDPKGQRANLREAILNWADLRGAILSGADLRGAILSGADLRGADLRGADLRGVDLSWTNLSGANLSGASLRGANLRGAILIGANLSGADLSEVNLRVAILNRADLRGAILSGAILIGANLSGVQNIDEIDWSINTAFYPLQCPETGAYTGYKKAHGLIVELEIPADALRSSATTRECRASKAKVISITNMDGTPAGEQVESNYEEGFLYVVGQTVEVPNFDPDRWNECAPGIHHYITRAEAMKHV